MSNESGNLIIGILFGVVIGLIVFLARQSFLQKQCDNLLIKENKPRSFVCVVRMQATVINKLNEDKQ
jgi:MFS superfamily sulfate permease-like transporter